jgi:hypothetical protein
MFSLLLAAAFAVPAEAKAEAPKLDGKWLIVYAEEGGRRNNAWEQQQATFKGNTLTYSREGNSQTMELTFGPHQTVKAMMTGGDKGKKDESETRRAAEPRSHSGVCIAGQDYFCISLEGTKVRDKGEREVKRTAEADTAKPTAGSFILILRRQRATKD